VKGESDSRSCTSSPPYKSNTTHDDTHRRVLLQSLRLGLPPPLPRQRRPSQPPRVQLGGSPDTAAAGRCVASPFEYDEIRILSANWESSMFLTWIMQNVLSELAGVPSTIKTGSRDKHFNFYDPANSFDFGTMTYDYNALRTASIYPNCQESPKNASCAHVLPEMWDGQERYFKEAKKEGFIEAKVWNGMVGKFSWYVPKYTAQKDPTLLSIFGLTNAANTASRRSNRRKLAKTFKRPFNWGDYCALFSANNCTTPDAVALRAPITSTEGARYHVDGVFRGKFNATDDNDCDKNPTTCTGHIVSPTCEWTNWVVPQAHHNNIHVWSNGSGATSDYSYMHQIEVLKAAVATRSDILFYWWTPDFTLQSYIGTDAELQKITLATPTQECLDSRISVEERCSADPNERIGTAAGSCDASPHALQKLIAVTLYKTTHTVAEALRSPGYNIVRSLSITDHQLKQIFEFWHARSRGAPYDAREAVCHWIAEHLDSLEFFPPAPTPAPCASRHGPASTSTQPWR